MTPEFDNAVKALLAGELLAYPTETFYALGCIACQQHAIAKLLGMKTRPLDQGVPLIVGSLDQLLLVCDLGDSNFCTAPSTPLGRAVQKLAQAFWPGPLTLVLPANPQLPPGITRGNSVAVRVTSHPVAQTLCLQTKSPLVASSANRRGEPPVTNAAALDQELLHQGIHVLDAPPAPKGGAPSTLARPVSLAKGETGVELLREGAIDAKALRDAGFTVLFTSI